MKDACPLALRRPLVEALRAAALPPPSPGGRCGLPAGWRRPGAFRRATCDGELEGGTKPPSGVLRERTPAEAVSREEACRDEQATLRTKLREALERLDGVGSSRA